MAPEVWQVARVFAHITGWPLLLLHVEADKEQAVAYVYSHRCDVYFVAGYTSQHPARLRTPEEIARA